MWVRRSKDQIIVAILDICEKGEKSTTIVYRTIPVLPPSRHISTCSEKRSSDMSGYLSRISKQLKGLGNKRSPGRLHKLMKA